MATQNTQETTLSRQTAQNLSSPIDAMLSGPLRGKIENPIYKGLMALKDSLSAANLPIKLNFADAVNDLTAMATQAQAKLSAIQRT